MYVVWQNELMVELHTLKKKSVRVCNYRRYKNSIVGEAISRHATQVTVQELYAVCS